MSTTGSRYAPGALPDYHHRFHAGNVGDAWKHCALGAWLRAVAADDGAVGYVETHAGEGAYDLARTGEWTEGVGRLWPPDPRGGDDAVDRYLAVCRDVAGAGIRPTPYPGSPRFARAALGPDAPMTLWERDPEACRRLGRASRDDRHATIHEGDGLAALGTLGPEPVAILVDPPWSEKADWVRVPDALAATLGPRPAARACLWYPVKSLTRPNAMRDRLAAAGIPGALVEVITTALGERRNRLNGSGMLLLRPPGGLLPELAAAAAVIGERCATRPGTWSTRVVAWGA